MAALSQINDQTTSLTLKTKPGAPACTTSIIGMTSGVEAAAIAFINNIPIDLNTAIHASEVAGASVDELLPFNNLYTQIQTDIQALSDLIAANL